MWTTRHARSCLPEERIPFDYLIVATGARHSYFGRDEWAAHAPGLKSIEDATAMRSRMLLAFEQAESEENPAKREAWLTFVVVGGGPTGVELAGALAELARTGLDQEYRAIDPATTRVILVQSGTTRAACLLLSPVGPCRAVAAGTRCRGPHGRQGDPH